MNKQELYQIAFSIINHKKLRNFGTSGHVESVVLMSRKQCELGGNIMAIANIKVTLLCPIEEVWNKITNLHDFSWRSDLQNVKIIDENNFVEISKNGI